MAAPLTATQWQQREIELLSRLRARDDELAQQARLRDAIRVRILRQLALVESELIERDHRSCADLVYAVACELGSTP